MRATLRIEGDPEDVQALTTEWLHADGTLHIRAGSREMDVRLTYVKEID